MSERSNEPVLKGPITPLAMRLDSHGNRNTCAFSLVGYRFGTVELRFKSVTRCVTGRRVRKRSTVTGSILRPFFEINVA